MADIKIAFKKRTLIARANKNMFFWVAIVSVVVSISIVGSIIVSQRLIHMNKVIAAQSETLSTIESDNKAIPDLQNSIRALNSNEALISSKAKTSDEAIQVILDALPSEANSLALGASFQNVLLYNIPGLTVQAITVDPVVGVESLTTTGSNSGTVISATPSINFRFSVRGPLLQLIEVLNRLEKSIRVLETTKVKIENQGSEQVLTVEGKAYYQPAIEIKLNDKTVK